MKGFEKIVTKMYNVISGMEISKQEKEKILWEVVESIITDNVNVSDSEMEKEITCYNFLRSQGKRTGACRGLSQGDSIPSRGVQGRVGACRVLSRDDSSLANEVVEATDNCEQNKSGTENANLININNNNNNNNNNINIKSSTSTHAYAYAYVHNENSSGGEENKYKKLNPTLEDVEKEIQKNGYHFSPQQFFQYYESKEWRNKNGSLIVDWKYTLSQWETRLLASQSQQKNNQTTIKSNVRWSANAAHNVSNYVNKNKANVIKYNGNNVKGEIK